jgi:hypothetical protein
MADNAEVCVLVVRATATTKNREHKTGERHSIMAVLAGTFETAERTLRELLSRRGWSDCELERAKMLGLGAGADEAVNNALAGQIVLHTIQQEKPQSYTRLRRP